MATRQADSTRESLKTISLLNGESKVAGNSYRLPRIARLIYKVHGVDVNGDVITVVVLGITRQRNIKDGHKHEVYFLIQFREVNRVKDRNSRRVRKFSGYHARLRLDTDMGEVCRLLEESRATAAEEMRGR